MTDKQKKIAVLVSGGGTNLQALIDAQGRGELGAGKITLVIASKPGVYALERAANAGIEGRVLARKDYDSIAAYSKALADEMTAAGIDLVVLAGFEHSVANMFYFGAAGMFFSVESIIYLAIVVLGNTIGGMLMPLLAMLKPKEA